MKNVIEIGNEKQKKQIVDELRIISKVCAGLPDPPPICGIWVPENFDSTVNKLQGTDDYCSERGHFAVAKNVSLGNETAFVFSKELFTEQHDNLTRMQIILHELCHAINKKTFPEIKKESSAEYEYSKNIYILFDEYWANRTSFEITEKFYPETSERYQNLVRTSVEGFLYDIINTKVAYTQIKKEIQLFRIHGDVIRYMRNISDNFDTIAKATTYFFSYIHHFTEYSKLLNRLPVEPFASESALNLGAFFKEKYENNETALFDGINYIQKFMEKFGMHFKDIAGGAYCTVLDI